MSDFNFKCHPAFLYLRKYPYSGTDFSERYAEVKREFGIEKEAIDEIVSSFPEKVKDMNGVAFALAVYIACEGLKGEYGEDFINGILKKEFGENASLDSLYGEMGCFPSDNCYLSILETIKCATCSN